MKTNIRLVIFIFAIFILGCGEAAKTPEWENATILVDKLDHPSAITTDGSFLYFVTGGTVASLNEGTSGVWKISVGGGNPTQLFKGYKKNENTAYIPQTFIIATDENYVYWSSGSIWKTPKSGGESKEIAVGSPTEMIVDREEIYWHNYVGEGMKPAPIDTVNKNGGQAKSITGAANISDIATDTNFIYWSQPDGIYRLAKTGGESVRVYATPDGQQITGMIVDADSFYFIQGSGKNALFRIPKNGGDPVQIAGLINNAYRFYLDENNIYFVSSEASFGTAINKVSKKGGEVIKLGTGYISSYTIGKDKIYVTDISKVYELAK